MIGAGLVGHTYNHPPPRAGAGDREAVVGARCRTDAYAVGALTGGTKKAHRVAVSGAAAPTTALAATRLCFAVWSPSPVVFATGEDG